MSKFDFKELIKETIETVYDPRAKHCWFVHSWSMWDTTLPNFQIRRCMDCGKRQYKKLPVDVCTHHWSDIRTGTLNSGGLTLGCFHDQRCVRCGELRRVELRTKQSYA